MSRSYKRIGIVYGDFDEVTLKPEYSEDLQKVIDLLNRIREKERLSLTLMTLTDCKLL